MAHHIKVLRDDDDLLGKLLYYETVYSIFPSSHIVSLNIYKDIFVKKSLYIIISAYDYRE